MCGVIVFPFLSPKHVLAILQEYRSKYCKSIVLARVGIVTKERNGGIICRVLPGRVSRWRTWSLWLLLACFICQWSWVYIRQSSCELFALSEAAAFASLWPLIVDNDATGIPNALLMLAWRYLDCGRHSIFCFLSKQRRFCLALVDCD